MTTSVVLGIVGGLLILVGLVGGGFSISGSQMPTVSKAVRIPCFVVGSILVFFAILLEGGGGGGGESIRRSQGVVQFAGGHAYVFQYPSLDAPIVGQRAHGVTVDIKCTAQGGVVTRSDGVSSSLWNQIGEGYIPDVNVITNTNQATMPNC